MSRFLARIFDADPHGWVLKGGVGMMVRLPHARYSHDIDLLVADDSVDPIDDLRRVGVLLGGQDEDIVAGSG